MKLGSFARNGVGYGSLLIAFVTASALVQSGCGGSDDATGGGSTGGSTSTGGSSGAATGGTGGGSTGGSGAGGSASGGTASGGTASGGTAAGGDTSNACGGNTDHVDPTKYPACDSCTGGHCVPPADFPDAPASILDPCASGGVCLPDPMVATKGNVLLSKCDSLIGNEGRCASMCIPIVHDLSGVLPQGSCAGEERCAPCFNPNDGSATGICDIGCDPGPTTQPILFTKCCGGRGDCIPRASIPGNAGKNLAAETCTGDGDPVCVPAAIVADPTYRFPACTASVSVVAGTPGVPAGAGVCVPKCIVDSTQYGPNINQGSCADAADKCVPCKNPINGQDSGACIQ